MHKITMPAFLLLSLSLLISGFATAGSNKDGDMSMHNTVTIKPSMSYEDCIEVLPGQIMHFSFDSSSFVNFNVHYHTENGLYYPVNKKDVMTWKGSLNPQELDYYTEDQESFCVMWDNLNSEPVKVSFFVESKFSQ